MEFEMTKQETDYRVQVVAGNGASPNKTTGLQMQSPSPRGGFLMTQLILRVLVVAFTLAATIITVTAGQTKLIMGFVFEARYKYSSAMRFHVGANAVVCIFSCLSLILLYGLARPKSDAKNYFHLLLHDLVMTILSISGCAAASAAGYLAKYGQKQSSWNPVCNIMDKFCHRAALALAFSYLAFFCLLVLTIMAAYKLKAQTTHKIAGDF